MSSAAETAVGRDRETMFHVAPTDTGAGALVPLVTSLLGQVLAGISLALMAILPKMPYFPSWVLPVLAAGFFLTVCVLFGVGKWEASGVGFLTVRHTFGPQDLEQALLIAFCLSGVVSFLAFTKAAMYRAQELSPGERVLRRVLGILLGLELVLVISGLLFFVLFAISWENGNWG